MIVAEAMTPSPMTAEATSSIGTVMRKLFEIDVRHLPIVDDGELVGIVSDRDLREVVSRLLSEGVTDLRQMLNAPIADLMSADVLSVDPETELAEAADVMIEQRIGALPVVSPSTNKLVGIISYVDILRAVRDEL